MYTVKTLFVRVVCDGLVNRAFGLQTFDVSSNTPICYFLTFYVFIRYSQDFFWWGWEGVWWGCACVYSSLTRRLQQFFSHIATVSGCCRELNAHFYSAASMKYHVPDTWHDTTPSHIMLALGRPVLALPRKSEYQARSS